MSTRYAISLDVLAEATVGAAELEHTHSGFSPRRLPLWTRAQHADPGIDWVSGHTAGVRLRLHTAARELTLNATFIRDVDADATSAPFPMVVVVEADGVVVGQQHVADSAFVVAHRDGTVTTVDEPPSAFALHLGGNGIERIVDVWLPHNAQTVLYASDADAPVHAASQLEGPRWLHYGSSISHGREVESPLGPWTQQASRTLGIELLNFGFAGNAILDPFVAHSIGAADADVITLKVGINVVNADGMRVRTFVPALHGFLDIVRAHHPLTPIAVITAVSCPSHEHVPGPTREVAPGRYAGTPRPMPPGDGSLTLERTRGLVTAVVTGRAQTDPLLWLVDGRELFGPSDVHHLFDDLHPDQEGHDLIASRFATLATTTDHPLGSAFGAALAGTDVREWEGARRPPSTPGPTSGEPS